VTLDERFQIQGYVENLEDERGAEPRLPIGANRSINGSWAMPRIYACGPASASRSMPI
jgi:hypothetical protein